MCAREDFPPYNTLAGLPDGMKITEEEAEYLENVPVNEREVELNRVRSMRDPRPIAFPPPNLDDDEPRSDT